MNTSTALVPLQEVREQLLAVKTEIASMLPTHIPVERYNQVVMTALERDPSLLLADRTSLMIAAKEAANDGLLPDKKEGAFVVYRTKVKVPGEQNPRTPNIKPLDVEVWVDQAKWMPMIYGVRKKMFQTGKVRDVQVELVYEHDFYERAAGDDAQIIHKPLDFGDRGAIKGGYAIIATLEGGVFREVMSLAQIEDVAKSAKTQTVWGGVFRTEMMRKTILRRLAKQVPLSTEVERVLARDDAFYDFDAARAVPAGLQAGGLRHQRARSISSGELFEDKAIKAEPVQDAVIEETAKPEHSAEVVEVVTKIRHTPDAEALLELLEQLAEEKKDEAAYTDEENAWIDETLAEQCAAFGVDLSDDDLSFADCIAKHLGIELETANASEPDQAEEQVENDTADTSITNDTGEPEREGNERPPLGATITSALGFQRYEDPELWASDILNKLSAISGAQAVAFWKTNEPFILKARDDGYGQAERILTVAVTRGLHHR